MAAKKASASKAKKSTATPADKPAAPPPAPAQAALPATSAADEPTVDMSDQLPPRARSAETTLVYAPRAEDAAHDQARHAVRLRRGSDVEVRYERDARDLDDAGAAARIEMGYRFDEGPVMMAVIADGQRNVQGILVRRAARITVPADARQELQVWFRLQLTDGRVLWDSAFARNHRIAVG